VAGKNNEPHSCSYADCIGWYRSFIGAVTSSSGKMGQKNFSGKEQADTISCSKENNRETGKPIMKRKDPFFPSARVFSPNVVQGRNPGIYLAVSLVNAGSLST
jgi:hypothetical protein